MDVKLDCEESWAPKNWCFWAVVLEKTLESPLDCKEIQPVHPKGDQSWVFIRKTVADAETPILWAPHVKSWLIGEDPDAGRDWGQEEKGTTEDEMAGLAALTRWTWVWVNFRSWWWTGRPGVLWFMGSQTVGHNWATELNWTEVAVPKIRNLELIWENQLLLQSVSFIKDFSNLQNSLTARRALTLGLSHGRINIKLDHISCFHSCTLINGVLSEILAPDH